MNILIVSATVYEISDLIKLLDFKQKTSNFYEKKSADKNIDLIISGIGLTFTAYSVSKAVFSKKYDLVINSGIAGSFTQNLQLGEVVQVVSDQFADLGIEDKEKFIDIFEAGFVQPDKFPFNNGKLKPPVLKISTSDKLKKVESISVNTVSGNKKEIEKLQKKYAPDTETMEGAAVFYVCMQENIPVIQIRGISNYVENRDKSKWNIPLAVKNLNGFLIKMLSQRFKPLN